VTTSTKPLKAEDFRITAKSSWAGAWKYPAFVGALGLGIAAYGWKTDPDRFAFSYLFGFFTALSLPIGCLFFVIVQYITKSSWSITVRRTAELMMRPMPIFAVLVIPLVLTIGHLFPWLGAKHETPPANDESSESPIAEARGFEAKEPAALRDLPLASEKRMEHAEERAEEKIIDHKRFYLNRQFFLGRLIAYLLIWTWLVNKYFRLSTEQDATKALENTSQAQSFAPPALILFGLSLSYFAFDWLLSLDGTWYSTIFGVQVFAQCALFGIAAIILLSLSLRSSGLLGKTVTVEHYHDLGKLLFGWIIFWSYISFFQFFLTWYSNIPDEVAWFHKRWHDNGGSWKGFSISLVIVHFFVPFWFLMSRNVKRRLPLLAAGAVCMALMHVVEVYWIILPNFGPFEPSLVDLGCLFGIFGIYFAAVLRGMEDYSLVAVGDPRLQRALDFENA
jgi:hypothetical protein